MKHKLHKFEYEDFTREYSSIKTSLLDCCGIFHDRYIVLDYNTPDEIIYHCGASSKDGGNKVMTINTVEDTEVYHPLIDRTLLNPKLELRARGQALDPPILCNAESIADFQHID